MVVNNYLNQILDIKKTEEVKLTWIYSHLQRSQLIINYHLLVNL
jgi:hypothetical protein